MTNTKFHCDGNSINQLIKTPFFENVNFSRVDGKYVYEIDNYRNLGY